MQAACYGTALYNSGDRVGKALAYVSLAPYLTFIFQAVVVYSRRELHALVNLAGMLLNAAISIALKDLVQQQRPADTCEALQVCHSHGMPSSHTQVMFFCWALHMLYTQHSQERKPRWYAAVHAFESFFLGATCVAVGASRVYLGYHTAEQVLGGVAGGVLFALVWFACGSLLSGTFPAIERWRLARLLHFKDTLHLQNPLQFEYEAVIRARTKPAKGD